MSLSPGIHSSCLVFAERTIKCWGENSSGQLGDGTVESSQSGVSVAGINSAVKVSVALTHACALLVTKEVACWGDNSFGQLADGSLTSSYTPVLTALKNVVDIDSGDLVSCALLGSGAVYCWGFGGPDASTSFATPTLISGLPVIRAISISDENSCAVSASGEVFCWQYLGLISRTSSGFAESVPTVKGALTVGTSDGHACATTRAKTTYCWGSNDSGQLGDGSNLDSTEPVEVASLTGASVISLSLGSAHTCALLQNQTVKCWGDNAFGQLGSSKNAGSAIPVDIFGLSGVTYLASFGSGNFAIDATGTAHYWGYVEVDQPWAGIETYPLPTRVFVTKA